MEFSKVFSQDDYEVDENTPPDPEDLSPFEPPSFNFEPPSFNFEPPSFNFEPPSFKHDGTETGPSALDEIVENEESVTENNSYKHKELVSHDASSEVLEVQCGEPMVSQHLRIDFKPLEGLDESEFLLKKCRRFWTMIERNPQIHHLKVFPQKNVKSENSDFATVQSSETTVVPVPLEATEAIKKQGHIVNDMFMNKFNERYCEQGSGDYFKDLPNGSKTAAETKWVTPNKSTRSRQEQRDEASKLCAELEQWDLKHPKYTQGVYRLTL